MAGNTDPVFSKAGDIQAGNITAGAIIGPTVNTAQDGSGSCYPVWQADATNGGFIQFVRFKSVGSPAATVARIYVSTVTGAFTVGTSSTVSNTTLISEVTLPVVTLAQTVASPDITVPLNFALPAGYRILVSFGTSTGSAGTGYAVTGIGGKY